MKKKKILLTALIIVFLVLAAFVSYKIYLKVDMENRFKEFEKTEPVEASGTLLSNQDGDYYAVSGMDYVLQDGVSAKVDSIMMTDDTLNVKLSFKFDKEINFKTFSYGFSMYDENNNIYYVASRMHMGKKERYDYPSVFAYRELGVLNNMSDSSFANSYGMGNSSINEEEKTLTSLFTLESKDKFPKSKKIYIKLFDLGYYNVSKDKNDKLSFEDFSLTDSKWLFSIDIPDDFNQRNTINLATSSAIPGLDITSATISETKLILNFNSEDYISLINAGKDMPSEEFSNKCKEMLNVTDGEGKVYTETRASTTGNNSCRISFDSTLADLPKKLFVNFKVGDLQYSSELVEK